MSLELQIVLALVLDAIIGDPRWFPHPVRLIGWLALKCEKLTRAILPSAKLAGIISTILVLIITGLTGWGAMGLAGIFHPLLGLIVSILILYTCFAGRDLALHSHNVCSALADDDLTEARNRVGMIVGRDTAKLDQSGVVRACVESVAENMVDGVTAPLFWAIIGGPLGVLLYKAINTMDSIFGYKNERYLYFGWAPAQLDDLANFLPARISGVLVVLTSFISGLNGRRAWNIFRRDRLQHASPNSAHTEAAVAGALGIRLGGDNLYSGKLVHKPGLGDPENEPAVGHILLTNRILLIVTILFVFTGLSVRLGLLAFFGVL